MHNKTRKVNARKTWIQAYERFGSISKAARRCSIPRSTLYRWLKRYTLGGLAGLQDKTQKPNKLSKLKVTPDIEKLIIDLRKNYKFGPKRISIQLLRNNNIKLSESTM
ncbi:MAG: helix-turn-helix domain-containing protein [Candidatus Cardinium sp.]|uniref:helix-turn-helix domain-containing protein n=1 Tax=Candidatus Cardinium sp. TP TaxID=2961955 RepID=UPI0021AEAEDD|nr:helix-turn-helix domain-containing protein [Candidatus Cardinium sp. TP]MCT4697219.1 helix-turn-helix domain-containing protein [Candidatus Cardinium sp. TP]MDN5247345.1 helix-turn-helix domain-containing protein [Candidatus Cardinium sp.]